MTSSEGHFEALGDFKNSLFEVDILCVAAKASVEGSAEYSTFNKSALLLIAGKFESFAESIFEEFVFKLNELKLPCHKIPDQIRLQHSFQALRVFESGQLKNKNDEIIKLFGQLGKLWVTSEMFCELEIDNSFSYGKHGSKEFAKLFEKIGIADVFEEIKLTEKVETVSTEEPLVRLIDFRGVFNSVCSMRNNILHQDVSPNLNTVEIEQYRQQFAGFAAKLDAYLKNHLRVLSPENSLVTE